ncbi:hypothetical protein SAY86_004157 [Trapa natans]|uniref:Uncharacterized protein n=1 Tax=Trapa natans TaxID=22666 RepID=A0AAN7MYA0_TRANT|nr:hypothetical protein SAY86_004157 [Trapa natans]
MCAYGFLMVFRPLTTRRSLTSSTFTTLPAHLLTALLEPSSAILLGSRTNVLLRGPIVVDVEEISMVNEPLEGRVGGALSLLLLHTVHTHTVFSLTSTTHDGLIPGWGKRRNHVHLSSFFSH